MATIIFFVILISGFHFVYDGIIAPNLRMSLRYKLFALRDILIDLKLEKKKQFNDEAFSYIHESINTAIRHLPNYNITNVFKSLSAYNNNPELREFVKKKRDVVEQCSLYELQEIDFLKFKYSFIAFIINSGGWAIYLFPIILLMFIIIAAYLKVQSINKSIKDSITIIDRNISKDSNNGFEYSY